MNEVQRVQSTNDRAPDLPALLTSAPSGATNFRTSVINLDRPGDPSVFDEQTRAEAAEIIARYPEGQSRSALLPMLHLVQSVQGYVTPDGIAFCADTLGITKAQVAAVVTFYTMFKRSPTGEYLVSVCTNTLCGTLGGDEIFATLRQLLGVGDNETTSDGLFTLEHAECLAACDYAPIVTVNYEFFDNQTVDSARGLVDQLRDGSRPMPTRGAPLCSFKEISRQIAGFYTDETFAPEANGSGVPTEVGVKLAVDRRESAPSYSIDNASSDSATKQTAKSSGATPRKEGDSQQPTSEHDAPLQTSESDPANSDQTQSTARPEPGEGKGD
jgi:NADH-quinone oxidoreductase subunit E